jgi:hypothetical protein
LLLPTATLPKFKELALTVSFAGEVEFELTEAAPPPQERVPAAAMARIPKRQGLR